MNRNFQRLLSVTGVALLMSVAVMAQSKSREERREEANSRAVQGLVTSPDDAPVRGAVVMLKDLRSLQVRSFITQDDGTYHFSGLKGDVDYELMAKSGESTSGTRKLSVFDGRKEANINLKLEKK